MPARRRESTAKLDADAVRKILAPMAPLTLNVGERRLDIPFELLLKLLNGRQLFALKACVFELQYDPAGQLILARFKLLESNGPFAKGMILDFRVGPSYAKVLEDAKRGCREVVVNFLAEKLTGNNPDFVTVFSLSTKNKDCCPDKHENLAPLGPF
jgi:hypothetical protein